MATEVSEWTASRLANGEFLNYSNEIARVATGFDTEKIPVAATLAELKSTNAVLTDFINEARGSVDTASIAALDAKRDSLFKSLYNAVEYLAEVEDSAVLFTSAHYLKLLLAPYKGLYAHSLTKETEEIYGLKFDLEKTASVNALKETGLYKIAGYLFDANDALKSAYASRTDAKGAKEASKGGETTASLRKTSAALVVKIIHTVNALNAIDPNEATTAAADKLAGVVAQHKLVASQHSKKKKDAPDPDEAAATS